LKSALLFLITALLSALSVFAQTQDITPPTLTALSFTPTAIDTSTAAASVTVSFSMTDDLTGAAGFQIDFVSPSGLQLRSMVASVTPGKSVSGTVSVPFPQYGETGLWKVRDVYMWDAIGNSRWVLTPDLVQQGFPAQLIVGPRYRFSGFQPPINNTGLNSAKAGRTIAVKWQLSTSDGSVVNDPSAVTGIFATSIACANGLPGDSIPAETSGQSGLRFDNTANQFIFTWSTDKAWSGTCRRLQVNLNDGTAPSADFTFK
jgi:hypothetical protein